MLSTQPEGSSTAGAPRRSAAAGPTSMCSAAIRRTHCPVRLHGAGAAAWPLRDRGYRPGWRRHRDRIRRTPAFPAPAAADRDGAIVGAPRMTRTRTGGGGRQSLRRGRLPPVRASMHTKQSFSYEKFQTTQASDSSFDRRKTLVDRHSIRVPDRRSWRTPCLTTAAEAFDRMKKAEDIIEREGMVVLRPIQAAQGASCGNNRTRQPRSDACGLARFTP